MLGEEKIWALYQARPLVELCLWAIAIQLLGSSEPRLPFGPGEV